MPATLVHMTLASERVDASMHFYRSVFGQEFVPVRLGDVTLYRGSIAGMGMVICPSGMAAVHANRSRHQLQFQVENVEQLIERCEAAGGKVHTPLMDHNGRDYAVVCDPDNNTIEFVGYPREDA
ncbi:MAG TPA: VOC family protein [Thermomicrobiales bacterium]|nr:VOC family protein [Thermomicrobiales bacterium]